MALTSRKKILILVALAIVGVSLIVAMGFRGAKHWARLNPETSKRLNLQLGSSHADIRVIDIYGVIEDPYETLETIEEVENDTHIKGVLIRIDSPGGAVGPSQEIFEGLMALREHKKVYCSLGDIAASGGYYIAAACEKIFANAGTLTGSIGVIMEFKNVENLLKWAKISPTVMKAGRLKDAVQESRKLSDEIIQSYADGRIFTGAQAKELGFVDELGGERVAIHALGEALGIADPQVFRDREKKHLPSWLGGKAAPRQNMGSVEATLQTLIHELSPAWNLRTGVPYYLPPPFFSHGVWTSK
jgi:protease-4